MTPINRDRNKPNTEDLPLAGTHIDQMSPVDALGVMLNHQSGAIDAVRDALSQIETAALAAHQRLAATQTGRLIYAGAGTSARIGVQDGVELTPTFNWPQSRLGFLVAGGHQALMGAIENAEDDDDAGKAATVALAVGGDDVVIALAASGQTPFTRGVLQAASAQGALTIGISNNADAPLLHDAAYPVLLCTGGEIIAGSTRLTAGTAQKICLNLISNMIMVRMGFVLHGMMVNMVPTNAKLRHRRDQINRLLKRAEPDS